MTIMKKVCSLALGLGLIGTLAHAVASNQMINDDTVWVKPLTGSFPNGVNQFDINYSYLVFGARNLVISYTIDRHCSASYYLKAQQGVSFSDKVNASCSLRSVGTFPTHVEICSYAEKIPQVCDTKDGQITVY
jgi:hypothetical protein